MKKIFGTKAETLERLQSVVKSARILPQLRFSVSDWKESRSSIIESLVASGWLDTSCIVRSSALVEDCADQSLAGKYTSVLDVNNHQKFNDAVEQVIQSYNSANPQDQVFVQPMLTGIAFSGVAFSQDPSTGGPYIVINYDDMSQSTSSVTSGASNELKVLYCFKHAEVDIIDPIRRVVTLVRELEDILATDRLDVEFAVLKNGELYLLQVRPLVVKNEFSVSLDEHRRTLADIESKVRLSQKSHPYLYGSRSVFGVMPDWNPAEIIGIRPRPLALSLYKELVMDSIWAYQRDNYGYKNLRSFPLMMSFSGLPYIDVRVDFNSFIPADVDDDLSDRLVNYYIDRLVENPTHHDKVEFEIIYTCYTMDLPERLSVLRNYGFSKSDSEKLEDSLRRLTNGIINGETGLWKKDLEKIKELETRRKLILESTVDPVSKIYWLLEDCKRYGTLPFAGLARAGFIAIQILKSLVKVGVLSSSEYDAFMGNLETVSSSLGRDLRYLNKKVFLERYGHLRPGTYDILSPRYDETPDRYFDWDKKGVPDKNEIVPFVLSLHQLKQTEKLLKEHKLDHDVLGLYDFIKMGIEGREYAKFVFSHSLSDALFLIKELGQELGLSIDECSYLDIQTIKRLYASSDDVLSVFQQSIADGKRNYQKTSQIVLPPLITKPEEVWMFQLPQFEPNFITIKRTQGHVAFVNDEKKSLDGSILFIPCADPGYDWIFSHNIKGFVTKYGGVNSHMAIRASELGIPAIIGAGEALYLKWASAKHLEIDCINKQVQVLR